MGFHDTRLPESFSKGSLFGLGFDTKVVQLDSGQEHRLAKWLPAGRRKYNLEKGISSVDDLITLTRFYLARSGALNSFRVKDWFDYASNATGTLHRAGDVALSHNDQEMVQVLGGVAPIYQMVKRYVSGPTTIVRTIRKPVSGTALIGANSVLQTSGFTVDYSTGRVAFTTVPANPVTAGFQYDVPCRFSEDTDKALQVALEAPDTGNLPEISCIEDVDPVTAPQDFPYGGAKNFGAVVGNTLVTPLDGKLQIFAPTTTGRKIILPDTTNLPLGGPYFVFVNAGTQAMSIETSTGSVLLASFATGALVLVFLGENTSAAKTWFLKT